MTSPNANGKASSSDPVDVIDHLIRNLSDADRARLASRMRNWPPRRLAHHILVPVRLLRAIQEALGSGVDEAIRLAGLVSLCRRTHQNKRGLGKETQELLSTIGALREARVSWRAIDNRLGLPPGKSREIWRNERRRLRNEGGG